MSELLTPNSNETFEKPLVLFAMIGSDYSEHMGRVVEETDSYFIIENPITMAKSMTQIGNMSVSCLPFMLSANSKFRIEPGTKFKVKVYKGSMAWSTDEPNISEELITEYKSQVSGIILSSNSKSKSSLLI